MTTNDFEDFCTAAFIPESCCLLKDVIYPLYNIDELYWTPWKSVDYDADFFLREAKKLEEQISNLCATISLFDEIEDVSIEEDFLKSDNLFDTTNFKELILNDSFDGTNHYEYLEVPQISNSVLHLKHEIHLQELLKSLLPFEIPSIFKEETAFAFEDLETPLECKSSMADESDLVSQDFERFEEIILPKMPDEDLSLEHLSLSCVKHDLSPSNSKYEKHHVNIDLNENKGNLVKNAPKIFSDAFNDTTSESSQNKRHFMCSEISENNDMSFRYETDYQLRSLHVENKFPPMLSKSKYHEIEEYNSDMSIASNEDIQSSDSKYLQENLDSLSEICNDDFFSENLMDLEDSDLHARNNQKIQSENVVLGLNNLNLDICSTSIEKLGNFSQSDKTNPFLLKLSKLDFAQVETSENDGHGLQENVNCQNLVNCSTAFRYKQQRKDEKELAVKQTSEYLNSMVETEKVVQKSHKTFNLLSSFICVRKKENDKAWSLGSTPSFSQTSKSSLDEECELHFKNHDVLKNNNIHFKENFPHSVNLGKNKLHLADEDTFVRFPDDYVKLILEYETATAFYVQKLIPWQEFKLSYNLTIVDISLEKTRFMLNQEVKNCQDRNLSPLEGGISYSYYIQLLILHGILKSLNCLIHFGAQLAVSSLNDYTKKHAGLLKGCLEDLIGKVSTFIENLSNAVHPKIKQLGTYLQDKYYFCKDNTIPFKVLIILKEHLTFFYSAFEAFVKTLLPEIVIDLIPESCFLEQETDNFSENKEHIYVACVSSVSKNIPWKKLSLCIEYDVDEGVCWKAICNTEKVAHAYVRFDRLPLKTLNEIKNLPSVKEPFSKHVAENETIPVILFATVALEYNLKSAWNKKKNIMVYERSYKQYLPNMHFADVTIDYRTSVTIILLTAFLNDAIESLIDKIISLHLKYEICWIIIHVDLANKNLSKESFNKIKMSYIKFYYTVIMMKSDQSFKVKFLYAEKNEAVVKWINVILSKNMKYKFYKSESYSVNSLTANISEEELFLVSFPSLNPIVASIILSSKISLCQLMNTKLEDLCAMCQHVPERFIKHFYSLIHERVSHTSESFKHTQENVVGKFVKFDQITRSLKDDMHIKRPSANSDELIDFINCLEKHHSFKDKFDPVSLTENVSNKSSYFRTEFPDNYYNYSDMSVEEIDMNYKALKLQDMASTSFNASFGNNFDPSSGKSFTSDSISTTDDFSLNGNYEELKLQDIPSVSFNVNFENNLDTSNSVSPTDDFSFNSIASSQKSRKHDSDFVVQQDVRHVHFKESQTCSFNELASSRNSYRNLKYSTIHNSAYDSNTSDGIKCTRPLHCPDNLNSQNLEIQKLDVCQFKYKKKRKAEIDFLSQNKFMKYSPPTCLVLHTSPRLQKGQSSKTVCKQVSYKNTSPTLSIEDSEINDSYYSSPQLQTLNRYSDVSSEKLGVICSGNIDSSWVSQSKITLTPRTSLRLSYEKIPGMKGQTRLTFH